MVSFNVDVMNVDGCFTHGQQSIHDLSSV